MITFPLSTNKSLVLIVLPCLMEWLFHILTSDLFLGILIIKFLHLAELYSTFFSDDRRGCVRASSASERDDDAGDARVCRFEHSECECLFCVCPVFRSTVYRVYTYSSIGASSSRLIPFHWNMEMETFRILFFIWNELGIHTNSLIGVEVVCGGAEALFPSVMSDQ